MQQQQPSQQPLQQPQISQAPAQAPPPAPQRQMVNMSDINPIMGGAPAPQQVVTSAQQTPAPASMAPAPPPLPPQPHQTQSIVKGYQSQPVGNPVPAPSLPQSTSVQPAPTSSSTSTPAPATTTTTTSGDANGQRGSSSSSSRHISDRQQVLRHQQQRLLLLRHAAKCQHDDGRCPVTPHCSGMKRLWKHIAECKDQKCLVPHCVSSRYVLSHYHRCKDVRCPVCGPVREAIHRSHEKQKQMQALKARHQQAVKQQNLPQSQPQQQQQQPPPARTAAPPVAGPAPSSALMQPAQPGPVASSEPPSKRRKPNVTGAPVPVTYPQQPVQQRPQSGQPILQQRPPVQPSAQGVPPKPGAIPTQPLNPNVKAGYVYSNPPATQAPGVAPPPAAAPAAGPGPARPAVPPAGGVPGIAYSNGQVIMPKHTGPKPQEDHTLINCFSIKQIETHIESLNKGLQLNPQRLKTKCLEVHKVLQSHQHAWVFNTPVDPIELGLPDYFEVIKRPMDLGTIKKRLENGCYHSIEDYQGDVCLSFDNAMLYNPEGSVVWNMASEMKTKFEQDYASLIRQLQAEEEVKRKKGDSCLLCGCEKLLFEPPVFYCNGLSCPSKRIRRNSYYYVGGNNQYHWCHQCFGELKEGQVLELADVQLKKDGLTKKKNDEVHEESWVQCDQCERWIHQICALFNTRQNKDQRSEYTCPRCTIEERKKKGMIEGTSSTPMAEDLPRTKLSERLENHVRIKVDEYFDKAARDKAATENIPLEEAQKGLSMGGPITIRQVTSMDRKLEVRERMKRRYAFKNYPDEFTFRCKCIVVFQNLDGVDVILFGLYVFEHDEKNPAPNTRTVYVSYLDSVHYMRPRRMRTLIYHEILISYLDYVRAKGFRTAHIWACPPLKGDDYILYAKPEDQKTPRDDRLRQWYLDMLVECQKRGIVGKVTNMYDLYFANGKNDATVVPYMDGDYFPGEVENIIKDIEDGKAGKKSSTAGKKKKANKAKKKKSGRGGTRSTGIDEDALAASGILQPGVDAKSLQEGGRDYVMAKLGETIQPMKESFIVAFLASDSATPEQLTVPKSIQEYRDKHGIQPTPTSKPAPTDPVKKEDSTLNETAVKVEPATAPEEASQKATESESSPSQTTQSAEKKEIPNAAPSPAPSPAPAQAPAPAPSPAPAQAPAPAAPAPAAAVASAPAPTAAVASAPEPAAAVASAPTPAPVPPTAPTNGDATNTSGNKPAGDAQKPEGESKAAVPAAAPKPVAQVAAPTANSAGAIVKKEADSAPSNGEATQKVNSIREGKFAAMAAKKRTLEGKPKPEKPNEKTPEKITVKDSKGRTVKVTDDDVEEMDCEFLNNRQAFLNLCQGNHYQFDALRRAKHSSMMVLWHLHNRDAPKFVQQCAICSREILTGYRYHCPICADYDQCHDCISNPNSPRHPHQLKPIPVASGQQSELTEAQRKERQRSIQLHMTLLLHAATCTSSKCPSANCTKMKGLLKHGSQCQVKATGGCHVCKRIWALLQLHARQCKASSCPVPNCMAIRERFRQLKKQQQAMDDRRRQEMNRHYRGAR